MYTLDTTESCRGLPPQVAAEQKFWYVPDRRIRTRCAARRATETAEWARTGNNLEADSDEHALFAAFHTCAFKAAQCARRGQAERDQWSARWRHIREYIVKNNLGLVYVMLARFSRELRDDDARLSEALYGLARAVERFNPWEGYRFSTYACNVIARGLMRSYRRERRHEELFPVQHDACFERPSRGSDPRAGLVAERLSHALENNLAGLSRLEAKIINQRFPRGPGRKQRATFYEIGNAVGLSKERVRQIQNEALKKLRTVLQADPVLL
jgi:RNA polymerase primary sigma factor